MSPIIALIIGYVSVLWLLRKEAAARGPMSAALWVPFLWLLIQGSRPVSSWFGFRGSELGGNPLEATVTITLYLLALVVLLRRRVQLLRLPVLNATLFLLLFYLLLTCAWAPYSFVALKRWSKELGALLIALVILTEHDPADALRMLGVRCAQVLFPLSIVLYKYYPHFGRDFGRAGVEMITGVTPQKNSLGTICAVFGLILIWDITHCQQEKAASGRPAILWPKWVTLGLGMWLLVASESKTSLLAFAAGLAIFFSTKLPLLRRIPTLAARMFLVSTIVGLVMAAFWTTYFEPVLEAMGRNSTFTDRTTIWHTVLDVHTDPLIGVGFYSFWIGPGADLTEEFEGIALTSAHSGYLETYLDGGFIGCGLLLLFVIVTSWRLANAFSHENSFSRIMFAFAIMCAIMNFSESYYLRLGIIWFVFEIGALAPRALLMRRPVQELVLIDEEGELAPA